MIDSTIRDQFPILSSGLHYLDNAATTLKPQVVIDAEMSYYREYSANVHRGLYPIAEKATQEYESARDIVAVFLQADRSEVVFTKSATHASNMMTHALSSLISKRSTVITTVAEHHSAYLPWKQVSQKYQIPLVILPLTYDGTIDLSAIEKQKIDQNEPSFWILHHISNVTGVCQDLSRMIKTIRTAFPRAIIVIDACQSVSHVPVSVKDLDCDVLFFSGHKLFGPTGVGVLWIRKSLHEHLEVSEWGGEMVSAVIDGVPQVQEFPHGFEAGTPAIAQVIGLGAAIQWYQQQDQESIKEHLKSLGALLLKDLMRIDSVDILFPKAVYTSGIVTGYCNKVHPHDIAAELGLKDIAVRAGYHCAQPLHEYLNLGPTIRISLHLYNSVDDVHAFIRELETTMTTYRR